MRVLRAQAMGMCFGVKEALEKVMGLPRPDEVTVYGQLVHNGEVNRRLREKGISLAEESSRSESILSPRVVLTAHGVSDRERLALLHEGKKLIDTTCPLVRRVHELAKDFSKRGYFVVVIGRKDHVEVKGLTGDLEHFAVVETPEDVRIYDADRIGILCQTTTPPALLDRLFQKIARKNFGKEIRFVDTICRPTRERQEAVEDLLAQVEALVVVGGKNSNNTRQLTLLAQSRKIPAFQVEKAEELNPDWLKGFETVGLTAGTSTLDETIEEVYQALLSFDRPTLETKGKDGRRDDEDLENQVHEYFTAVFQEGDRYES
jgi:4-hydroxy-3-methylbut-2-enyl diphosphate reductase